MNFSRTLLALAAISMPSMAQSRYEASVSLVLASGDLNKMASSNNLAGYSLGGAVRFEIKPGLDHRFHLDAMSFRSKTGTGLQGNRAPKHLSFGYDVVYQSSDKLSVFGGLLGMKWKQDSASATLPDFTDKSIPGNALPNNEGKGTKLGARIGLEYAYTKNWKGVFSYTQTEFNKRLNPGWYNLGVTYRF